MKKLLNGLIVFLSGLCIFFLLSKLVPVAPDRIEVQVTKENQNNKELIEYVALGDSLTEGIGDLTEQGGFVPLVANELKDYYGLSQVITTNFGKSGDRSDQILKRMDKNEEIMPKIAEADFVTLTVGGNDLMKVIQDNFFGLKIDSFEKPLAKYQQRLQEIITKIRSVNPDCPIYVLGIYNPFYLNFPEIEDMQTVMDNWNQGTQETVQSLENSYFIPINDLLYKGIDNEVGITSEGATGTTDSSSNDLNIIKNNALYEEDHFHPNNLGYQLMANAVRDELIATQDRWLKEDTNE